MGGRAAEADAADPTHSLTISPGLGWALGDCIAATYRRGEPALALVPLMSLAKTPSGECPGGMKGVENSLFLTFADSR